MTHHECNRLAFAWGAAQEILDSVRIGRTPDEIVRQQRALRRQLDLMDATLRARATSSIVVLRALNVVY